VIDAVELRRASGALAAMPGALRGALAQRGPTVLAQPLADALKAAVTGPWAGLIAAGVHVDPDPLGVTIGGTTPTVTGGAGPSTVAAGVEYGGGHRVGTVRAGRRAKAHRRRTTVQFSRHRAPYIAPTIDAMGDQLAAATVTLIDDTLTQGGLT